MILIVSRNVQRLLAGTLFLLIAGLLPVAAQSTQKTATQRLSDIRAEGYIVYEQQNVVVAYRLSATHISVYLDAPTTGWFAIGFDPQRRMLGADIVISHVRNGILTIRDDVGQTDITHVPDTQVGGRDDVVAGEFGEFEGRSWVRFDKPRASGTAGDAQLGSGSHTIIWAYGPNGRDDFVTPHLRTGMLRANF